VLAQHPNKFAGYAAFAKAYVQALQNGESLDAIAAEPPQFELIRQLCMTAIPVHHQRSFPSIHILTEVMMKTQRNENDTGFP
jgi:hypothetical protein